MTIEEKGLILAWNNFHKAEGGQVQRHGLGLKFGRACCAARDKFWSQGRKGEGFQAVLERSDIPIQTAHRWMNKYAQCGVTPENWIAQAKVRLATAEGVKQERGREAARQWQRRYRAIVKEAEQIKAGSLLAFPHKAGQRKQETDDRIDLAGRLMAEGRREGRQVSQRSISLTLFSDHKHKPEEAYANTRQLFSRFRDEIDAARDRYLALWAAQKPSA